MKKKPITPKSQITSALRMLWLRSRERREAIKLKQNTCEWCDTKGSVAKGKECKIEIHHKKLINWKKILKIIYEELLVSVKYEAAKGG
jgi:hypothetical protein